MKLPEKILYSRKRAGLSQEALADIVGVSRQAVSKWETGETLPETAKLAALASALGVSVDWLLSDSEPEEPRQQPEQPEDWTDKLPRMIRRAAKRWGWLAGVYLAVSGAILAGIGALARVISRSMFDSFMSLGGSDYDTSLKGIDSLTQSGMDVLMDMSISGPLEQLSRNNPVYLMGGVVMVFGLVLCVTGIVLAIVLKRKSR